MNLIKPICIGALVGAVAVVTILLGRSQEIKYEDAAGLIAKCPVDSMIKVELSTPLLSSGLKVTCIYQQFIKEESKYSM